MSEFFHSMTAKPVKQCPHCGKNTLERQIGIGAAVVFKGSGFYQTDYRSESYKKAAEAESKPAAAASGDSKSSSEAKPSESKSGESSAAAKSEPAKGGEKPATVSNSPAKIPSASARKPVTMSKPRAKSRKR
jgi:predicted nucleic acid-binding Zn ribbon protein